MIRTSSIALFLSASTGLTGAQIHETDLAIGVVDGQLRVGSGERDAQNQLIFNQCVFGVELDSLGRAVNPGFDTDNDTLIPGERIGYAYPAALRRWDGAGFETIPTEQIRMSLGPVRGFSTPLEDPAEGEEILGVTAAANSFGEFHHHFTFRLELDGSPATSLDSLGAYLLELRFYNQSGLYEMSPSIWLVLDNNALPSEINDAIAAANAEFGSCGQAPACPADVNGDGMLNGLDFGAWLGAFNTNDPAADQNADGMINGLDFGAWLAGFNAGCD